MGKPLRRLAPSLPDAAPSLSIANGMTAASTNSISVMAKENSSRKQPSRVAILGFGTVGSSVARILSENPPGGLELTHICNRDVERKRVNWLPSTVRWTNEISDVLSSDVDIVVELIGGLEPAGGWVRKALRAGKSVVTANKQLIARHGTELVRLAREHNQQLTFGASLAGGMPV